MVSLSYATNVAEGKLQSTRSRRSMMSSAGLIGGDAESHAQHFHRRDDVAVPDRWAGELIIIS